MPRLKSIPRPQHPKKSPAPPTIHIVLPETGQVKLKVRLLQTTSSNDDNMIETINVNGVTTNFTYDANNQRTKKTQRADTTLYYSQDFEVINNTPTSYLFAGNLRIGMISSNATMFFVKDHLGSTNAIVTDTGEIVDTGEYMPYGQDRSSNDLLQTSSYKFTDQEQDDGTGLYNYDARLYDPVIGQFIMADTMVPNMFDSQSLNRYDYCLNNPVKYVDPSGHSEGLDSMGGMGDYNGYDSSSYENHGHSIADVVGREKDRQEAEAKLQTIRNTIREQMPVNIAFEMIEELTKAIQNGLPPGISGIYTEKRTKVTGNWSYKTTTQLGLFGFCTFDRYSRIDITTGWVTVKNDKKSGLSLSDLGYYTESIPGPRETKKTFGTMWGVGKGVESGTGCDCEPFGSRAPGLYSQ